MRSLVRKFSSSHLHHYNIASREDLSRNTHPKQFVTRIGQSKDFRPNLGYLTQRTSTFASRLAQGLTAPHMQAGPTPSITRAAPRTPKSRIDPTIAARRLERLEREKKLAQRSQRKGDLLNPGDNPGAGVQEIQRPPQPPPHLCRGFRQFEGTDGVSQAFNRPSNSDRSDGTQFESRNQPWREGLEISGMSRMGSGRGWVGGRGGMRAGSATDGSGRTGMSVRSATVRASQTRARDGPPFTRRTIGDRDQDGVRGEDATYEILEAGGEPTESAQLTNPDFSLIDLDVVLALSPTPKSDLVAQEPDCNSFLRTAQRVLEVSGGKYTRFASQTPGGYIVDPQKLGPMKHAQLTLAKRRDVTVNQRLQVTDIVTSLVGGTN